MFADFFVRTGTEVAIHESSSEGYVTLAVRSECRQIAPDESTHYAEEKVTLYLSLESLATLRDVISAFQAEQHAMSERRAQGEEYRHLRADMSMTFYA